MITGTDLPVIDTPVPTTEPATPITEPIVTTEDEQMMRVAAGAAFMDSETPGWWNKIELDTFNLRSPACCVLGQVHGGYHGYLGNRFPEYRTGFCMEADDFALGNGFLVRGPDDISGWQTTENLWRAEITQRQTADETS